MPVRGVGFDLDYTLVVPERDRESLLAEALDRVGGPRVERAEYLRAHREHMTSETREPIFAEVLSAYDSSVSPRDVASVYRYVVNTALVPVTGAGSLVRSLQEEYAVGLLTNGPAVAQREKLSVLGWEDLFDHVVIAGEIAVGKPAGSAFEELIAGLEVEPAEVVFVGDEVESDIRGAVESGIRAIQVMYPGGPDPDPRAITHIDRSELPAELPGILREL